MNKTKIDWCDSTWNPVTGCLHGCEYCYARGIANRFKGGNLSKDGSTYLHRWNTYFSVAGEMKLLAELDEPVYREENGRLKIAPYPYGFYPTLHRYRMDEYRDKKGRNIFVGSMTDLFGEWVPEGWQKEVFEACLKAPQHNYLFLTKAPEHISRSSLLYSGVFGPHEDNFWFGTTVTCQKDLETRLWPLLQTRGHVFLSIEPLLEELDLDTIWCKNGEVLISVPKRMAYYLGGGETYRVPEWVILGAETGRRKEKVVPEREWIQHIVATCREAKIPVFMKSSLAEIWGEALIQEFPEGLLFKKEVRI